MIGMQAGRIAPGMDVQEASGSQDPSGSPDGVGAVSPASPGDRAESHPKQPALLDRTLVLVGLMGAGKSCIGKRLAARLSLPFADADTEVEKAAGCSIPDIFELYGEVAFRDCERRVMRRMLEEGPFVLATGGGAFMDPDTRALIKEKAVSLWLRADLETLVRRCGRRDNRPLLKKGNPTSILAGLIEQRYPVYAEADLVVDSRDVPADRTVETVIAALKARSSSQEAATQGMVDRESAAPETAEPETDGQETDIQGTAR